MRCDEDEPENAPWYQVQQVLRIPPEIDDSDDDPTWAALVYAVRVKAQPSLRHSPSGRPLLWEKIYEKAVITVHQRLPLSLAQGNGYIAVAAMIFLAVLLNLMALYYKDTYAFFILFAVCVATITSLRGWRTGAFAALISSLAVLYFFVEPVFTFSIAGKEEGYRLLCFSLALFGACVAAYSARQFTSNRAVM